MQGFKLILAAAILPLMAACGPKSPTAAFQTPQDVFAKIGIGDKCIAAQTNCQARNIPVNESEVATSVGIPLEKWATETTSGGDIITFTTDTEKLRIRFARGTEFTHINQLDVEPRN